MPIKKVPFDYVHPRKKQIESNSEKPSVPDQAVRVQLKTTSTPPTLTVLPDETVSVRLLASIPKSGVSAEFDEMVGDNISHKTATLALLKKGLSMLEADGNKNSLLVVDAKYPIENDYVETIRAIRRSTYEWVKNQYDPHDILSARALGAKLGTAILGFYFSSKITK